MRHFLLKLAAWVVGAVLAAWLFASLNQYLLRFHTVMLRPGAVTVLVMGDSHAASGLDPSAWPGAVNLGLSAEPLIATFYKLQVMAAANPTVESVVMSLGPHNISAFRDTRWAGGPVSDFLMEHLIGIVPIWEWDRTRVHRERAFSVHLRKWWTPNLHLVGDWRAHRRGDSVRHHTHSEGFWGDVTATTLTDEELEDKLRRHFSGSPIGIARGELAYLDSIVDWTQRHGIDLAIVRTPEHPRYRAEVPVEIDNVLDSVWTELAVRPNVTMVDLSEFTLPDSAYFDHDHLNSRGAALVSAALLDSLPRQ